MKKIILFVGVISMISLSCNKDVNTKSVSNDENQTPLTSRVVSQPNPNFSITFNGTGSYSTSDAQYINSFPQLKKAVESIASTNKEKFMINVNEEGFISSSNTLYDGLDFTEAMTKFGNFYFEGSEKLTLVYGKEGFKSISNPELFEMFPELKVRLIENGEIMKNEITNGKDMVFTLNQNDILLNGVLLENNTEDLAEFGRCTRYYWWMGWGAASIACAYTLIIR